MHSYLHHIGDFDKDTRHLTRIERSIYSDLIDLYYLTESCLPDDNEYLCRKIIARSNEESTAVEQVLKEFFHLTPVGWYHVRCEEEIEKYKSIQSQKAAAGRASAEKRAEKLKFAIENPTGVQRAFNGTSTNQEPKPLTNKTLLSSGADEKALSSEKINYQGIVDLYNRILPELPKAKLITDKRRSAIKSCCSVKPAFSGLDFWEAYFTAVRKSQFLMGSSKDWAADFDFLTTKSKFVKVYEGAYQ
jgi:uncharacterized protein YdaU (DUF1376 family)